MCHINRMNSLIHTNQQTKRVISSDSGGGAENTKTIAYQRGRSFIIFMTCICFRFKQTMLPPFLHCMFPAPVWTDAPQTHHLVSFVKPNSVQLLEQTAARFGGLKPYIFIIQAGAVAEKHQVIAWIIQTAIFHQSSPGQDAAESSETEPTGDTWKQHRRSGNSRKDFTDIVLRFKHECLVPPSVCCFIMLLKCSWISSANFQKGFISLRRWHLLFKLCEASSLHLK